MTATDELRRMLDERGVEWWKASPRKTKWNSPVLGGPVAVSEWNGKMVLDAGYVNVTPEQAIAATLGDADLAAENAKLREEFNKMDVWHSKELTAAMDENAKLRELARDANIAAHMLCEAWEGSCSKEAEGMSLHAVCPISDTSELCVFGKLYDRMRELGVEVD